jgi:peptidoglycan/xylan/chitin deacetylase (PgdA/CDA1 family)
MYEFPRPVGCLASFNRFGRNFGDRPRPVTRIERSPGLGPPANLNSLKHTEHAKFFNAHAQKCPTPIRAAGIPILMYHRVAAVGPLGLERFRVDPTLFDEQLSALRHYGYSTIGLNDGVQVLSESEDLVGKPIIITFDDGYRDFLTALPSLQKYLFGATVFLVAGRIGGFAEWDTCYGETASLMSWPEIREIAGEGTELGCHSLTHRPMTEMNYSDLLRDTCQARKILEDGLGTSMTHFAYPYGAENKVVRSVIGNLGFSSAVSCRPALARFGDEILSLPRIEVTGSCMPEELIVQIEDYGRS